jgi:phosphoribosylamine--glycine ligase
LMRLKTDLIDVIEACIDKRLLEIGTLEWDPRPAVCVVMAAEGYPGKYQNDFPIRGLDEAAAVEDVKVFHAGTRLNSDGQVVTAGGRVLGVTALGSSVATAKLQAYKAVKQIRWQGAWCRKDIADRALNLSQR